MMRENPVHTAKVVTSGLGKKVGYICYNSFDYGNKQTHDWDDKLKEAFIEFKNAGVN